MSSTKNRRVVHFRKTVWSRYRRHGRHNLPWRKTHSPYRILVSEIMLQQTQVDRVVPYYRHFVRKFPSLRALASASLGEVLAQWSGLGYNRRAKYLHDAAKTIVARHSGGVPREREALLALPGIGRYSAAAIRTFAWNEPELFIETNIRTALIHHFFPRAQQVPDAKLYPYMDALLVRHKTEPREWYFALMDYGAHIKKTEGNASRRSAHHTRQKLFKGSDREIRGAILKLLSQSPASPKRCFAKLPFHRRRIRMQLRRLLAEGLITFRASRFALHD